MAGLRARYSTGRALRIQQATIDAEELNENTPTMNKEAAKSQPLITLSRLQTDLSALGIAPGDTVMFHVSVREIGWIVGGPDIVIQALLGVVGPQGTIMMYTGCEDSPYRMDQWDKPKFEAYLAECPPYDPLRSRAHRRWSILTEYLRTWPGACRSAHPDSFTAVGKFADFITRDHSVYYGYGEGSPLHKLCQCNGKVLLLGSPLSNITLLHFAEDRADIPGKRVVKYKVPVLRNGERVWTEIEEFDTSNSIVALADDLDYFPMMSQCQAASLSISAAHNYE